MCEASHGRVGGEASQHGVGDMSLYHDGRPWMSDRQANQWVDGRIGRAADATLGGRATERGGRLGSGERPTRHGRGVSWADEQ